jgi:hypothetical protein
MANHSPKGAEYMRTLARRGAEKSVETRRKKKALKILIADYATQHGIKLDPASLDVRPAKRPNRSGGSHDTDWRCPCCRHFNSIKRRACAKCHSLGPANGRLTRAALRELAAEHRTAAILAKHGL